VKYRQQRTGLGRMTRDDAIHRSHALSVEI
jgi:hypothetical protein